jgi:CxxC motif-containing protein
MNLVCLVCPNSCLLAVERDGDALQVANNGCSRGLEFALKELDDPERTLTSTVKVLNGEFPLVSVRSDAPVKKAELINLIRRLDALIIEAPINSGQALVSGLGVNKVTILATRTVAKLTKTVE